MTREGAELRFAVIAGDADADPLAYSVLSGLPEARGSCTTCRIRLGTHVRTVGGLHRHVPGAGSLWAQDSLSVNIGVFNINRAPALAESNRPTPAGRGEDLCLEGLGSRRDPLEFSAENLPEGATLDSQTGRFVWIPGPGQAGEYLVTFLATDGQVATRQTVVLLASLEQIPPTVRIEQTPSFPSTPGQEVLVSVQAERALGGEGISSK